MTWPVYIEGEVAVGLVDGFNRTFKTATDYVPGSLVVYRNGLSGVQNDADKADFEAGLKLTANAVLVPQAKDGRLTVRTSMSNRGICYVRRVFSLYTATPASIHNINPVTDASWGDLTMVMYDADVVAFVVLVGFDIWFAVDGKKGNTYSENIRKWGRAWPPFKLVFCFTLGLLAGHFFWSPVEYVKRESVSRPAAPDASTVPLGP